ncbi:DNA cytosine methyltransferase [uncultured Sulfitobacter sp.]|uniref:DNA cytosine methyltransferase n=1 Tax=uncultured Sulfitobacter sp. TaxID=191468 RepID=UPI0026281AC9|nr:DNA cytosine methyltransferase [uncultured Sulfitobacter sp.]
MINTPAQNPTFAEFFAGGGMARAGLGEALTCTFANDIDPAKCATYRTNWGGDHLYEGDVAKLPDVALPDVDMWWASSPCQDFSLAGNGQGLNGERSGVFKDWIDVLGRSMALGRTPKLICFENVAGLITRNKGRDFGYVLRSLTTRGYQVGALSLDAKHFLPQSRPRLFVVAVRADAPLTPNLKASVPNPEYHSKAIRDFVARQPRSFAQSWVWWDIGLLPSRTQTLQDLIEPRTQQPWQSAKQVDAMLNLMSPPSRAKLDELRKGRGWSIGTVYKRGRPGPDGKTIQRAELRNDGIAGCLRTPAGGSSRQIVVFVKGNETKARLLSRREVARLMGLPESYILPDNYNAAYKLAGDGVAVPVVAHLCKTLITPLLCGQQLSVVA